MILALQTTTFGAFGGIPTYNRLVCRVLNETTTGHVLILTDNPDDLQHARTELPNLEIEVFSQKRLALTRNFLRLALSCKFDLVLIGHVNYAPLGSLLKKLRPNLKFAVMLYGVEAWQPLPKLKRRALHDADFLISISEHTKHAAANANGLDLERIHVLPNALEWTTDLDESARKSTNGRSRLLSVCRLEETEKYKGVDTVIEAMPVVLRQVPNLHYTIVGGGSDLARHQELAAQHGVQERVHFAGYLGDKELRASYQNCDLFVMPSGGEGFGFVFLEAMKYRKAVVAADSGGAPEVVLDGTTGALVPYGDKEKLAAVLTELCLDPAKRQRMGEAGHECLQAKFTYPHFKQRLTEILSRELSRL